MKKALITGIAGQDGSYLAELLLDKGYEVHGTLRRVEFDDPEHTCWRIAHLLKKITLHIGELESSESIDEVVKAVRPDECYHLAAQSFVYYSFDEDFTTIPLNVNGTQYVLAALKKWAPQCRIFYAGSSEMFGFASQTPQNEKTPFCPRSPYGISKIAGYYIAQNFKRNDDMFIATGFMFNHESPRRESAFVTRKIARTVARIVAGHEKELRVGSLDAQRDWGFAGDYVKALWAMLQQKEADDYVIATGEVHSVEDFIRCAFGHVGLDWKKYVVVDESFIREEQGAVLRGDFTKAKKQLGWEAHCSFEELVQLMVEAELKAVGSK